MKKSLLILFGTGIVLVLLTNSCADLQLTNTELLTGADWQIASATFSGSPVPVAACLKDDVFSFETDGSISVQKGSSDCDQDSHDGTVTGTWIFLEEETRLHMTGADLSLALIELGSTYIQMTTGGGTISGVIGDFDIVSLTRSNFTIQGIATVNAASVEYAITFSAI